MKLTASNNFDSNCSDVLPRLREMLAVIAIAMLALVGCGKSESPESETVRPQAEIEDGKGETNNLSSEDSKSKEDTSESKLAGEDLKASEEAANTRWSELGQQGFVEISWPADESSLESNLVNGLKRQQLARIDEGLQLRIESGTAGDKPPTGAIRFQVEPSKGVGIDFDLSHPNVRNIANISLIATNERGKKTGRWRWKLPPAKELRSQPRQVVQLVPGSTTEPFKSFPDDATMKGAVNLDVVVQVKPKTFSQVVVKRVALLPGEAVPPKVTIEKPPERVIPNPDLTVTPYTGAATAPWSDRKQAIADSIQQIQTRLESHGGAWEQWYDELNTQRSELKNKLVEVDPEPLMLANGAAFRRLALVNHEPSDDWPDPQLRMLLALDEQLSMKGIDLIVVPVPSKEQIFAPQFLTEAPADGIVDVYREFMYHSFLRQGLEFVDLRPALSEASKTSGLLFYEGSQRGQADRAIRIVAREAAKRLARYGFDRDIDELGTAVIRFGMPAKTKGFPPESRKPDAYQATKVVRLNGADLPRSNPSSPVLLVTDSFCNAPGPYGVSSADIAAHLTKETGVLMERVSLSGAPSQAFKRLAEAGPGIWKGRKVCLFLLNESHLFRNGPKEDQRWDVGQLDLTQVQ